MPDETQRQVFEIVTEAQKAKADLQEIEKGFTEIDLTSKKASQSLDEYLQKLGQLSAEEQRRLKEMQGYGMSPESIGRTMTALRETDQAQKNLGMSAKDLKQSMGQAGQTIGGTTRQLGFLDRATRSVTSSWIRWAGHWVGAYAIFRMIRNTARDWTEAHEEMDQALADFSWRVSSSEADLAAYRQQLLEVSRITGQPIGEIAGPLAGQAGTGELARATAASQIFGRDTQYWLREGTEDLDAYASAMRLAGMTTKEFSGILQYSEMIGQEWNISTKESVGLLSGLIAATGATDREALKLADSLTKLYESNQTLMRLGVGPTVTVGAGGEPVQRPLPEVMTEISNLPQSTQRQIAQLIGVQEDLFISALQGWGEISQAIQQVNSDTQAFSDAYGAHSDSISAKTDRLGTAWSNLLSTIGDTEVWQAAITTLTMALEGLAMTIEVTADAAERLKPPEWLKYLLPGGGFLALADLYEKPTLPKPTPQEKAQVAAMAAAPAAATGPAAWQEFRTTRLPEGVTIERAVKEMERIISEEFTGVFETATGELVEVTQQQIDAERQLTLVLDEQGRRQAVDIYGPAWSQAIQGLREDLKDIGRLNVDRLRDITPQQFDIAMQTRLPYWESRLTQVPGFEEKQELFSYFVGSNDVARQQLATQTAMAYTLQDILEQEKKQLEGAWNIPAGVTMRVPLQSLDLMRWMTQAGTGGAGAPGSFALAPEVTKAAGNLDGAGMSLTRSAVNLDASARQLSAAANMVGGIGAGASLDGGIGDLRQGLNVGQGVGAGGGGALTREITPYPGTGAGTIVQQGPKVIRVELTTNLDGRTVWKSVEQYAVAELQAASRRVGGLRP